MPVNHLPGLHQKLELASTVAAVVILFAPTLLRIPPICRFVRYFLVDTIPLSSVPSDVDPKTAERRARSYYPTRLFQVTLVLLNTVQVCLSTVTFGIRLSQLVNGSSKDKGPVIVAAVTGLVWSLILLRAVVRPTATPPWPSFLAYTVFFAAAIASLVTAAFDKYAYGRLPEWASQSGLIIEGINATVTFLLIVLAGQLRWNSPPVLGHAPSLGQDDKTTVWEWLTFSWMTPVIFDAASRELEPDDLLHLSPTMFTHVVFDYFRETVSSSLLWKLVKANRFDLIVDCVFTIASSLLEYLSPFFLQRVLEAIGSGTKSAIANAYVLALLTFASSAAKAVSDLLHLWHSRRTGIRVRSELTAAIYEKALRRKDVSGVVDSKDEAKKEADSAKKEANADTGKVVNLMSNDTNTISGVPMMMNFVWANPLQITIAAVYLYKLLGWSAFAGIVVIVVTMPINSFLSKRSVSIQKEILKARDKRISVMTEIINAITFIKFFAWTRQWQDRAAEARRVEMRHLVRAIINSLMFTVVWIFIPIFVTLSAFFCYVVIAKQELTVPVAFTTVALFQMLRQPLNTLPMLIVWFAQCHVSLKRVEDFLDEDDVPDWVCSLKDKTISADSDPTKIGFEQASLRWNTGGKVDKEENGKQAAKSNKTTVNPSSTQSAEQNGGNAADENPEIASEEEESVFELVDLNIDFPIGKLTVVSGPTGAGKTAILVALLGEMELIEGRTFLPKNVTQIDPKTGLRNSVAYCAQTAWLQQQSIKDNILFGEEYDEERYDAVVEACALEPDFDILEDGDQTEIGAKGVSLSGGQKARVALARAVYSYTQHVLLDDPLAAVDSHTAKHLTDLCLNGPLLKGRTVIIVSHHVDLLLPTADYIVRIVDGRIDCQGSPNDLRAAGELDSLVAIEEAEARAPEAVSADAAEIVSETSSDKDAKQKKEKKKGPGRRLVKDEERSVGNVKWHTYKLYIQAATTTLWILIVFGLILEQFGSFGEKWWLKEWGKHYGTQFRSLLSTTFKPTHPESQVEMNFLVPLNHHILAGSLVAENTTRPALNFQDVSVAGVIPQLPPAETNPLFYVSGYAVVVVVTALITFGSTCIGNWASYRAAVSLHDSLLDSVIHGTVRFFNTTPLGRIINRFTKDVQTIDTGLASSLRVVLSTSAGLLGAIGMVSVYIPVFLLPAAFIMYAYYTLGVVYLRAGRSFRRLEATLRSPIFSGFAEIVDGIVSVRAYSAERRFFAGLCKQVDHMNRAHYGYWMSNRWLLLRFDLLGAASVFLTTLLALSGQINNGDAAIAITSAQAFVMCCYWLSRFWGELEMNFNSVERVEEYLAIPHEPASVVASNRPPAGWPSSNPNSHFVSVQDVEIKYAPELPTVFKGSFDIKAGEKIGLIGRTGSGKSTIAMSLLRFTDPASGRIMIDDIDITSIGIDDLRSRLTYIPQDAVLFSGTVRENLDPFKEHTDAELLEALSRVNLIRGGGTPIGTPALSRAQSQVRLAELAARNSAAQKGVKDAPPENESDTGSATITPSVKVKITLETKVSAGGTNFSQGQRQLIAMARALLRRSNLIIMDEATASVDFETDEAIQLAIRSEFKQSTLITIAHRLSSVIDYDRVLVLADGGVAEFDTPITLLRRDESLFKTLCQKSGKYQELYRAAERKEKSDHATVDA